MLKNLSFIDSDIFAKYKLNVSIKKKIEQNIDTFS